MPTRQSGEVGGRIADDAGGRRTRKRMRRRRRSEEKKVKTDKTLKP